MNFVYKSHSWLAVAACIFTAGFAHFNGSGNAIAIGLLVGIGTLMVYNIQQPKLKLLQQNSRLRFMITSILGLFCASIAFLWIDGGLKILFWFGILYFISFWYNYPFPVLNKSLRELPFFKVWLITAIWTCCTTLVPFLFEWKQINLLYIAAHGCLFFALAVLFDERDRLVDAPRMQTIPQLIGSFWSRILATAAFSLYIFIMIFSDSRLGTTPFFYLLFAYFLLVLIFSRKQSDDFLYYFFIDSILIIIGLRYLII